MPTGHHGGTIMAKTKEENLRISNWKKHQHTISMDVGIEKGQCQYWTTIDTIIKDQIPTSETYKKNTKTHKKGEIKYINKVEYLPRYTSIIDAWKEQHNYKQTSAGLTHNRRDCLYLDFDCDCDKYDLRQKAQYVCDKEGLPFPTYITYHIQPGKDGKHHGDIIWVLDKPLISYKRNGENICSTNEKFVNIQRELELLFYFNDDCCADTAFTGWQIKNPFCEKFIKIIGGNSKITSITPFIDRLIKDQPSPQNKEKKEEVVIKHSKRRSGHHIGDIKTSRNAYIVHFLPQQIWEYMRSHDGIEPTNETIDKISRRVKEDAENYTHKEEYPEAEFLKVRDSVVSWATNNFNYISSNSRKGQHLSVLVRKCNKLQNLYKIISRKGMSVKEISNDTGLSQRTIYQYQKLSLKEFKSLTAAKLQLEEYVRGCDIDFSNIEKTYLPFLNSLNNSLSSLSYYYIHNAEIDNINEITEEVVENMEKIDNLLPQETPGSKICSISDKKQVIGYTKMELNKLFGLKLWDEYDREFDDYVKYAHYEQEWLKENGIILKENKYYKETA